MTTPPKDAIRLKAEEAAEELARDAIRFDKASGSRFLHEEIATNVIDSAFRALAAEKDGEIAELKFKLRQLKINLTLMHFVGMKVTCCWYSPNVFDRNYSAGAIRGSATCDCQPCTDWRNSKERT